MVLIEHIEKFVEDRPDLFPGTQREETLARAREKGENPIMSGAVRDFLGEEKSDLLFQLVESNSAYLKLSADYITTHVET